MQKEGGTHKSKWQHTVCLKVSEESYAQMDEFIMATAQNAQLPELKAGQLRMVVEEAVGNIISYSGATQMTLSSEIDGQRIVITIVDDGLPFDPTEIPEPDLSVPEEERKIGGLGIHFMRQFSDGLEYHRTGDTNNLTISVSY